MRILVIEDDTFIRETVVELLESEGYDVTPATNGQDGLDRLREGLPCSLILLDLMMPVKDGFEFRSGQLSDPKLAAIPVVVMSAVGDLKDKRDRLAAADYIRKPVDIDTLLSVVKKFS